MGIYGKTRYWYVGLGCTVMIAALYLMKSITDSNPPKNLRLFEGFVSFKSKEKVSNHSEDVLLLRNAVKKPGLEHIIAPQNLKMNETDNILSAFRVAGMDYGVHQSFKIMANKALNKHRGQVCS
jgi:hypothetical protein